MTSTDQVDPFTAVGAGARLAAYAALAELGPVHRVTLPAGFPAWLVTGHGEVRQALTDARLVRTPTLAGRRFFDLVPELAPSLMTHLLNCDGADHARLRKLVGAAFTGRRVTALGPRIEQIAEELLDGLGGGGEVDLLAAYAYPLPTTVICELIGVPQDVRADFARWTATLLAPAFAAPDVVVSAVTEMVGFARALVARKRREAGDDLISALVAARDSGDRLSEDELTSMIFLLFLAGHETTVNLIGNGVHALLTHSDQLTRVQAQPDLMPDAIEELLRFDGPVQVTFPLLAATPLRIGTTEIAAGDVVLPGLLAANRDPSHTTAPDGLDLGRDPHSHLAFGHGVHHCLGAPLARLEARIALGSLLRRFPRLRLAGDPEDLTWQPSLVMHGLTALPVRLGDPVIPSPEPRPTPTKQ